MDDYLISLYNKGRSLDYIAKIYYRYINREKKLTMFNCRLYIYQLIYHNSLKTKLT